MRPGPASRDVIEIRTGDEIGRLNYGTGTIPFVRTSDPGSWELKRDPKHGVSETVLREWEEKQDVRANDILLVRDGTYLVGTSVALTEVDLPLIYCGGILKIRCPASPRHTFEYAVRSAADAKQTVYEGRNRHARRRTSEVLLPVPRDSELRLRVDEHVRMLVYTRANARRELETLCSTVLPELED